MTGSVPFPSPSTPLIVSGRRRLARVLPAALVLAVLTSLLVGAPAEAAPRVSVSAVSDLDPAGATVTVTGSGFDASKGIYVALCVRPAPGQAPSPCLGGADTSGGGASQWISSNPPPYGEGLAVPYGSGGSFSVSLRVVGADAFTDCLADGVQCAVVTRADHTRQGDRSCDVIVPVAFRGQPAPSSGSSASGSGCSYDPSTDPLAAPPDPPPSTDEADEANEAPPAAQEPPADDTATAEPPADATDEPEPSAETPEDAAPRQVTPMPRWRHLDVVPLQPDPSETSDEPEPDATVDEVDEVAEPRTEALADTVPAASSSSGRAALLATLLGLFAVAVATSGVWWWRRVRGART